MKAAVNIAASNMNTHQLTEHSTSNSRVSMLLTWSQPFSWAMLLGLAMIGLWSYQTEIHTESSFLLDPVSSDKSSKKEAKGIVEQSEVEEVAIAKTSKDEAKGIVEQTNLEEGRLPVGNEPSITNDDTTEQPQDKRFDSAPLKTDQIQSAPPRKANKKAKKQRKRRQKAKIKSKSKKYSSRKSKRASVDTQSRPQSQPSIPRRSKKPAPQALSKNASSRRESNSLKQVNVSAPPPFAKPPPSEILATKQSSTNMGRSDSQGARGAQGASAQDFNREAESPIESDTKSDVQIDMPPSPWQSSVELWARGERQNALTKLITWIERNRYHRKRPVAIRLGVSWAKLLENDKALTKLTELRAQTRQRQKRRKSIDQTNYQQRNSSSKSLGF